MCVFQKESPEIPHTWRHPLSSDVPLEASLGRCFCLLVLPSQVEGNETPHKLIMTKKGHLQNYLTLRGYLDEAEEAGTVALSKKHDLLESLMCANATARSLPDIEALVADSKKEMQEWLTSRDMRALSELYARRLESLSGAVLESVCTRLQTCADVVQPFAGGLPEGACWKTPLAEDASLAAVFEAAKPLVKGKHASKFIADYKALKQDHPIT